jgi:hypothetical protein
MQAKCVDRSKVNGYSSKVQETDVAYTTARRAIKLLWFRPYRIQEVHRIKHTYFNLRITFCSWLLRNVHDGIIDPNLFFMIDEAWFHVSGYVNAQNSRIWDREPSCFASETVARHKSGCVVCSECSKVIGPIFFEVIQRGMCIKTIHELRIHSALK